MLNLRGDDIPFNPLFHSYLFVGMESATLFIEEAKLTDEVKGYLQSIGIVWRDYNELWTFLRRKEWGEGNVSRPSCLTAFISHSNSFAGHHLAADVLRHLSHADQLQVHRSAVVH